MATAVIIVGLVVFGAIIYLIITVIAYVGQASILDLELIDLNASVKNKNERIADYRIRADSLKNSVPTLKSRRDRLNRWIGLLKSQKAGLERDSPGSFKNSSERDAAIRVNLTTRKKKG